MIWLDILTLLAWGTLLLKYFHTGQLNLLIHPNYFWLVVATGLILLILASFKIQQTLTQPPKKAALQLSLFPPGLGSTLLLVTAILGWVIGPALLSSETALHRGINESLPLTQSQVQAFRLSVKPEERSLLDWVRTLNAYPEPDAYLGQKAVVTGFVIHDPNLPNNFLLVSRFVLTCCAVDAYSVGLPVQLTTNRDTYPPDTWIKVTGTMSSETFDSNRKLVIVPETIEVIPTPKNPYSYSS